MNHLGIHVRKDIWLLSIPYNNININAENDYAFKEACENEHMNVVKWLLSILNNNININAVCGYVFKYPMTNT